MCSNGEHKFEARYTEEMSDDLEYALRMAASDGAYEPEDYMQAASSAARSFKLKKYVHDICIICGFTIRR